MVIGRLVCYCIPRCLSATSLTFSIPANEAGVEHIVVDCIVNNDGKGMRKLGRIEEAQRIIETVAREKIL